MYWMIFFAFLAHVAEEYARFPAWATRHFGATSRAWYVYSHVVLVSALAAICASATASAGAPGSLGIFLATGTVFVLATNALFHVVASFLFREYSPGVVTGVVLFAPLTLHVVRDTLRAELLTPGQLVGALVLGVVSGVAVVASLWLPMNIGWRLERIARAHQVRGAHELANDRR